MRVVEDAWNGQDTLGPTVVTIGNFDGVHLGQRRILETVRERATATGVKAAAVTFEPHPLTILRADRPPQRLTLPAQKRLLLEAIGIDILAIVEFTTEFAATSAQEFVEGILHHRLGAQEGYVGAGFGFGRGREGDLAFLEDAASRLGFRAIGVDEVENGGELISSTRIRDSVRQGRVEDAARLLGRAYSITGTVVHGEGRGRGHGWPTINIDPDHELLPADGVYASQAWIPARGKVYDAVTNVGHRPTFEDSADRVVESHLFEFGREVYGERVELSFVKRLRGERRFPSADELVAQIERDASEAREYLRRGRCSTLVPTLV